MGWTGSQTDKQTDGARHLMRRSGEGRVTMVYVINYIYKCYGSRMIYGSQGRKSRG